MSSAEETQLLILKGAISDLPAEDQAAIKGLAQQIRDLVAGGGDAGEAALALVACEVALAA